MRSSKRAAQGYSDFYKRNAYGGEGKTVSMPEAQVSIKFGEGFKRFDPNEDTDDEMMKQRKEALRRRLKRMRKK